MEKATGKVLGEELRQRLQVVDGELPKELRRLIVQLEHRQEELDRQRQPPKRETR